MNHRLMFTLEKCDKLLQLLDKRRYTKHFTDFEILFCEGREFNENNLKPLEPRFRWGGYNAYGWLRMRVELPEEFSDSQTAGLFDFGVTGAGGNSGFEALCYLNGEKYQGVDINHKEVLLPEGLRTFEMRIMLWAGLDGGGNEQSIDLFHEIKSCEFAVLDKQVDRFYYLFKALIISLRQLNQDAPVYHKLLDLADAVYKRISLSDPVLFERDVKESFSFLEEGLLFLREEADHAVRCLGHTHIDMAWLWTLDHTREKAQRSFATVLRLMERYPDYYFFQSQPYIYSRVKEDAPELYGQIKQRVKEGRWEPNGGMWVEADCLLTSGESLARQFLYGKGFFREEFGVENEILWLPDVFGYTASLPQILKQAEVSYFMTTKISWNQYNRIPNDTFIWRGIDGSEVLTHFINTPSAEEDQDLEDLSFYTYNGMINANSVNGIWKSYQNKDFTDELLLCYGYGDGGGGVTRDMLEAIPALDKIPGNPKLKTGKAGEFFKKLDGLREKKELNVWDGELYLEFHRGIYTSQSRTKRFNRKLEFALRNSEILSLLTGKAGESQSLIEHIWKEVLTRQFHDILPGSSITEVYQEAEAVYGKLQEDLKDHTADLLKSAAEEKGIFTVFNPLSFTAKNVLFIETEKEGRFEQSGQVVKAQRARSRQGYYLQWTQDALSLRALDFTAEPGKAPVAAPDKTGELDSFHYYMKWDQAGRIFSLFDKDSSKELITEGKVYNRLSVFEDSPRQFDAWELEPYYEEKRRDFGTLESAKIVEYGEILHIVEFRWRIGDSTVTQNMCLYVNSRRIDFDTTVQWHETRTLMRVSFETDIRSTKAVYDIQFGNIERNTHSNTSWDFAKFEVPAQKWADYSQRGKGLALLNDCKYGYNVKDGVIGLSLLKSPVVPDKTADQGEQRFCYSILPHNGDFYEADVERESLQLNNPCRVFAGSGKDCPSFFKVSQRNVLIDAVKLSQDKKSIVVRLHEYAGMNCRTSLAPALPVERWREVNILERPVGEDQTKQSIELDFRAYEIKTVSLVFR